MMTTVISTPRVLANVLSFLPFAKLGPVIEVSKLWCAVAHGCDLFLNAEMEPVMVDQLLNKFRSRRFHKISCSFSTPEELHLINAEWQRLRSSHFTMCLTERSDYNWVTQDVIAMLHGSSCLRTNVVVEPMLRTPGISLEVVEDMDVDNDDAAAMPRHLMLISLMKTMTDVTQWPKVHLCEAAVVDQEDMDGVMRLFSMGARIALLMVIEEQS
jgi:hypothetical protein